MNCIGVRFVLARTALSEMLPLTTSKLKVVSHIWHHMKKKLQKNDMGGVDKSRFAPIFTSERLRRNNMELVARIEKALADGGERLSQWEQGFLESLKDQAKRRGRLSHKQIEILGRVEAQKCSAEAQVQADAWHASYNDEKRAIAVTAAKYYMANPPYFEGIAGKILNDPDYIPSEKAYRKMCENKYVKRVLVEVAKAPVFAVGDMVALRSGNFSMTVRHDMRDLARAVDKNQGEIALLVLSVNTESVTSAVKGAKEYTVLPVGLSTTFTFEERHLKKRKKSKKTAMKPNTCEEAILF